VVSTGVLTPESFGFDNPETTPLSIPTNSATPPRSSAAWSSVTSVEWRISASCAGVVALTIGAVTPCCVMTQAIAI
jgi:hypothetical protein